MDKQYVEDFKKGEIFHLGEHVFSEDEIVDFAEKYDPFPFHTNNCLLYTSDAADD